MFAGGRFRAAFCGSALSVVQRVLDDLLRQVVSGRRTGLFMDRNVSVVAVMGELGVIAEADSVFLSSGSRRCPIPGEVELIALYGDADALQIIQIRKAQAVRLGRDEHFDIALDGIVVLVGGRALSSRVLSAPTRKSMPSPPLAWAMPWL